MAEEVEFCDARIRGSGVFTLAVPTRGASYAGGPTHGPFKPLWAYAKRFRPLHSDEHIVIQEVPFGFGLTVFSPWSILPRYIQRGGAAETQPFTLNIPGVTDFIRTPFTQTPEIRKAQLERMRSSQTSLPEWLSWAPKMLNTLDNAQDILSTGLALATGVMRTLFPRVLARLLGPLGWLLLANDLLNLST